MQQLCRRYEEYLLNGVTSRPSERLEDNMLADELDMFRNGSQQEALRMLNHMQLRLLRDFERSLTTVGQYGDTLTTSSIGDSRGEDGTMGFSLVSSPESPLSQSPETRYGTMPLLRVDMDFSMVENAGCWTSGQEYRDYAIVQNCSSGDATSDSSALGRCRTNQADQSVTFQNFHS
jgi:hypothetical protein